MFKYNLKFAIRHLVKYKSYTSINIVGLALGMTCAIYIFLWIYNELNFDNFHKNKNQLYEVFWYRKGSDGKPFISNGLPSPVTGAILQNSPEVVVASRILQSPVRSLFKYKDKSFFAEGNYADTSFFRMFSFSLLKGNPKLVLKDPKSIVLSESLAKKLFHNEDPIGKTIQVSFIGNQFLTITGVFKNVPSNSTLQFDYLGCMDGYLTGKSWLQDWGEYSFRAFIQLRPGASTTGVNSTINGILQKYGMVKFELFIYPYTKLHTGANLDYKEYHNNGNIGLFKLLFCIALLVLIIACVNFMNLAIALSLRRTRVVGIKKIIGSGKLSLVRQFMGEAFLMTIIALLITMAIVEIFLPTFNFLFSSTITVNYSNPLILGGIVLVGLFTSFVAGFYPAIFLSSFQPISIIKGSHNRINKSIYFRHLLVVFQFTASIILIICTITVDKQIQYIHNKPLGFDKEHVIAFDTYGGIWQKREFFKNQLLTIEGVEAATYSEPNVTNIGHLTQDFKWEGKPVGDDRWFSTINVDLDFLRTFKISVCKGRDFSAQYADTTNTCIINETASKAMGLKEPVGEPVYFWQNKGKIVGVANDYHFNDLYQPIRPLVIRIWPDYLSYLYVRIKPLEMQSTIKKIKDCYQKYEPDYPFEYKFINNSIEETYHDNIYFIGTLSTIFSLFTIIIACLGLFGLTSFTAELRTKEIGIRKINGAVTMNILTLLLKSFTKLVAIAYLIACPIAWFAMHKWLESFAYKTPLSWWIFFITGFIAFLIAMLTVIWQAWRAAKKNPVEALRYE